MVSLFFMPIRWQRSSACRIEALEISAKNFVKFGEVKDNIKEYKLALLLKLVETDRISERLNSQLEAKNIDPEREAQLQENLDGNEIQRDIYEDSLNRVNLVQSGYKFININRVNSESQLDSDGFTRHGIQTFNLLIEEL